MDILLVHFYPFYCKSLKNSSKIFSLVRKQVIAKKYIPLCLIRSFHLTHVYEGQLESS